MFIGDVDDLADARLHRRGERFTALIGGGEQLHDALQLRGLGLAHHARGSSDLRLPDAGGDHCRDKRGRVHGSRSC
jgi:hypothetical protein